MIRCLKKALRERADSYIFGGNDGYPRRWMPAVSIRKATIRQAIEELTKK